MLMIEVSVAEVQASALAATLDREHAEREWERSIEQQVSDELAALFAVPRMATDDTTDD